MMNNWKIPDFLKRCTSTSLSVIREHSMSGLYCFGTINQAISDQNERLGNRNGIKLWTMLWFLFKLRRIDNTTTFSFSFSCIIYSLNKLNCLALNRTTVWYVLEFYTRVFKFTFPFRMNLHLILIKAVQEVIEQNRLNYLSA